MNPRQNSVSDDSPIFLVGFMGAGKTTVGRALARHLEYDFFDLDELIAARAGKSVQEIFAELGEAEFRRLEGEAIQPCGGMVRAVIALGGGAYVSEENRTSLRRDRQDRLARLPPGNLPQENQPAISRGPCSVMKMR